MPRGNPNIGQFSKGRPKGSKNKTPILMREIERVIFELPETERMRRLRMFRDYTDLKNPYKNYAALHMLVGKRQDENDGQGDMFDGAEEAAMIAQLEREAANKEAVNQ